MSNQDNGGPAFPNVPDGAGSVWQDWDQGMSLRDYFAAQCAKAIEPPKDFNGEAESKRALRYWAKRCYEMADALLEARK